MGKKGILKKTQITFKIKSNLIQKLKPSSFLRNLSYTIQSIIPF